VTALHAEPCFAVEWSVFLCLDGMVLPPQSGAREPLNMGDQLDPLEGKLDGIVRQLKEISEKVWLLSFFLIWRCSVDWFKCDVCWEGEGLEVLMRRVHGSRRTLACRR